MKGAKSGCVGPIENLAVVQAKDDVWIRIVAIQTVVNILEENLGGKVNRSWWLHLWSESRGELGGCHVS